MKTFAKFGLIGLALAASSAHADVFLPNTGNGELTLFVRNEVTGAVYARGLQIRLDSILTQADINAGYTGDSSLGIVQEINYALGSIGPDANLTAFLAAAGNKTWTIMAGDNVGSNLASNAYRYVTTTQVTYNEDNPSGIASSSLGNTFNNLQQTLASLNDNINGTAGTAGDGVSTSTNGQWRQTGAVPGEIMADWGGAGPDTVNALGTAANLYIFTSGHVGSGSGNASLARVYQGIDVILSTNGTLSAVAPVPLPAAVWMLASGL
ncbi:MAG: hypothetical protein ABUL69_03890, partial [Peristeroidobacter soli]